MKRVLALALTLVLLSGCGRQAAPGDRHILCTTYPVYLFTTAVTQGVDGIQVDLLVNQQTSCLHDYTLTVEDMRAVEAADVIVRNGAGLEAFLDDALAQKDVPILDCAQTIPLLPAQDEGEGEMDPHIWMDPDRASQMVAAIAQGLSGLDPEDQSSFAANAQAAQGRLKSLKAGGGQALQGPFITFHDGFQYFAHAFSLSAPRAIEEEEGAEISAKELAELIALVRDANVPAVFVEKNGSRRSADVIARETGCKVYELDMVMSGDGTGIEPYLEALSQDLETVREALG